MKQGVRSGGTAGPPPGRSPAAAAGTGTPSPRGASRGAPLREGEAFWEQPPRPAFLPPFHTQEGREPGHVQEKQPPSLASEGGAEWVYGRRVPTTLLSACRGASGPNRSKSQPRGHEGSRGAGRWPSSAPRPRQHLCPQPPAHDSTSSPESALKLGSSSIILKGESGSMKTKAKTPVHNLGRPGHEEPRPGTAL